MLHIQELVIPQASPALCNKKNKKTKQKGVLSARTRSLFEYCKINDVHKHEDVTASLMENTRTLRSKMSECRAAGLHCQSCVTDINVAEEHDGWNSFLT